MAVEKDLEGAAEGGGRVLALPPSLCVHMEGVHTEEDPHGGGSTQRGSTRRGSTRRAALQFFTRRADVPTHRLAPLVISLATLLRGLCGEPGASQPWGICAPRQA